MFLQAGLLPLPFLLMLKIFKVILRGKVEVCDRSRTSFSVFLILLFYIFCYAECSEASLL